MSSRIAILLFTAALPFLSALAARGQTFTELTTAIPGVQYGDSAWGDYDNDGDLDILITGYSYTLSIQLTRVYRNDGNGAFTDIAAGLPANWEGSAAWGDYDQDGDLDALSGGSLAGAQLHRNEGSNIFTSVTTNFPTSTRRAAWGDFDNDGDLDFLAASLVGEDTRIYRNDGNGVFTDTGVRLPGAEYPAAAWGDFDNDGDLDIAFAGETVIGGYYATVSRVYRNDGNAVFTDIGAPLQPLRSGAVAWGDFDNDSDLDLAISGVTTNSIYVCKLYRNDNGTFTDSGVALPGIVGSLAWGDYDNDGQADLLVCGSAPTGIVARIYRNLGSGSFTDAGANLPAIADGAWGDYDGDGDPDIFMASAGSSGIFINGTTRLLRNNSATSNSLPAAPTGLNSSQNGNRVTLRWQPVSDANQSGAHSFNLAVATSPGRRDVVSPMSDQTTGRRRVPERGRANQTNAALDLPIGTYYWRVQAVDHAFGGSLFSVEASFTIPAQQPKAITQGIATNASARLLMSGDVNPNGGTTTIYFEFGPTAAYGSSTAPQNVGGGTALLSVSNLMTTYQPGVAYHYRLVASNSFGVTLGEDRVFVPPHFVDASFLIPALGNSAGPYAWSDYDGDGDLDVTGNGLAAENQPTGFVNHPTLFATVNYPYHPPEWGDYDGDGDLDVLTVGVTSRVSRNDGGVFTALPVALAGNYNSPMGKWVDYDCDGDLDVFIVGTGVTRLYRNDRRDTFTEVTNTLPYLEMAAAAWADYDNDGDPDLALIGLIDNNTNVIGRIYRNEGGGVFTNIQAAVPALSDGTIAWGDYDNDGDPDLVVLGRDATLTNRLTRIYRNEGGGVFTNAPAALTGAEFIGAVWGDFNQDGFLDLTLIGSTNTAVYGSEVTLLFQNNGNGTFSQLPLQLPGSFDNPVWGDFDHDGRLDLLSRNHYAFPWLMRNNLLATNPPPGAPGALAAVPSNNTVVLSWNAATDANQPGGLSYNVRVGTATAKDVLVSGMANPANGWRRVPRTGNAGGRLGLTLTNAQLGGTYYWSVQAVDHSFAGSPFAAEQSFSLPPQAPQAVTSAATNLAATTAGLRGEVFAGGTNTTFYFDYGLTTNYGSKTSAQLLGAESRWIPVGQALSNLAVGATYHFRMVAFNGVGTNFGADAAFTTLQFSAVTNVAVAWYAYHVAPGDYDNDGDLDLVLTFSDNYPARLFRNEGGGAFTDTGITFLQSGLGTGEWADYDNDGDLDIALVSGDYDRPAPNIFRNNGNGTFSLASTPSGYSYGGGGAVHWGDYDNDGDPDLLYLPGYSSPRLIRNNGNGSFTDVGSPFGSGIYSAAAWADYDNDGDLDVVVSSAISSTNHTTVLHRNLGNGVFSPSPQVFQGAASGAVRFADLDNDGDPDLVICGSTTSLYQAPAVTKIYRNTGGNFAEAATTMPGVTFGRVAIGDYNNDGRADIFLQGATTNDSSYSRLWRNDGNLTFTDTGISGSTNGNTPVAWADFDKDGALDFFQTAYQGGFAATIYHNNCPVTNTPPGAPKGLSSSVAGTSATLNWLAATDANQSGGLTYNVRVGSSTNDVDVLAPLANVTNGFCRVAAMGNAQSRRSLSLFGLVGGNYYWRVQAVDHTFAGSLFSTQGVFIVNGPPTISDITNQVTVLNTPTPPIPFTVRGLETDAVKLSLSATSSNPILLPTNNIVFAGAGKNRAVTLTPAANQSGSTTITLRLTDAYGAFVMDSFLLAVEEFTPMPTGITALLASAAAWGDYDNDGDLDLVSAGLDGQLAYRTKFYRNDNGTFTEVNSSLPTVGYAALAWGDYDKDGFLDLTLGGAISGSYSSRVYRNNGSGSFSHAAVLPFSGYGSGADSINWGDYDNDGDLDVLGTGNQFLGVYRYDGGTNFTYVGLPGQTINYRSSAWCDDDSDGDLDILTAGSASTNLVTKLYRNQSYGTLVDSQVALPGFGDAAFAWGDYDNDGDPDLAVTGVSAGVQIGRIYRNDGNGIFVDINAGLQPVQSASVAWGDYDNDGDLDLLLTGGSGSGGSFTGYHTRIYRNNGGGAFTDIGAPLLGVAEGGGIWGDYDNDGDLDFFVFGSTSNGGYPGRMLYRNNSTNPNARPNPPPNVSAVVLNDSVTIHWNAATDSNQTAALTYNLRVGTAPGLANVVAPMANLTNGMRRLPATGNVGERLSHTITNLPLGTYYAAVQTVDHSFAGSDFSPEANFTVTRPTISVIPDQVAFPSQTLAVPFTVAAPGTSLDSLTLTATSSDTNLIANSRLIFSGSNSNRTLTLTPVTPLGGTATVAITVTDTNGGFVTETFAVRVETFSRLEIGLDGTNDFALPGDYDNDGWLDLFLTAVTPAGRVSRIYRNVGDGTFTNSLLALPPADRGAGAWGDFNNDGWLDLAMSVSNAAAVRIFRNAAGAGFTDIGVTLAAGNTSWPRLAWADCDQDGDLDLAVTHQKGTLIYRNDGDETFTNPAPALAGVNNGALAFGDWNNDGAVDLAIAGLMTNGTRICWVYENQGRGVFVLASTNIPGIYNTGIAWGDYDGDGDLDLALAGDGSNPTGKVFRNEGAGNFTPVTTNLPGTYSGNVAWGDYDNDGKLDLLVSASEYYGLTRILRNNGDDTFTDINAGLPGMGTQTVHWADLDRDGDLDAILSGNTNGLSYTYAALVYRNNLPATNSPPAPPNGLTATLLPENDVILSWASGSDAETIASGLGYNVRLGTTPGEINRLSPHADPVAGTRRLAGIGNAGSAHQLRLADLPRGTNYWSVQAIDSALAGSVFAAEVSFAITNGRPTLSPITNQITFPYVTTPPIPFTVDDAETPASNLVVTATSSNTNLVPDANIILGGSDSNRFLTLTPVGTSNATSVITIVVRDTGGLTVTNSFTLSLEQFSFTTLTSGSGPGAVAWADYDNDGDLDLFLGNSPSTSLFQNNGAGSFASVAGIPIASYAAAEWGDYNGDGNVDLLLSASPNFTRVYRNNGDGTFSDLVAGLPGLYSATLAWSDFDNDGDLDILMLGSTNNAASGAITRLYRQTDVGQFLEIPTPLPPVWNGAAAWADFDNDGDKDLLLSGTTTNNTALTRLYRNDGNGVFTQAASFASGNRSVAWGDYDNDGDLDALLGGTSVSRLVRNDGVNTFTEVVSNLPGVSDGTAAWGDFDSDGDLDILLSGAGATAVFRNDGGDVFTNIAGALTGLNAVAAAWADADGDGDLDFAILGRTNSGSGHLGRVYFNNFNQANTPPAPPAALVAAPGPNANSVVLSWSAASDAQTTNAAGLGYNLRVGPNPGAAKLMPSHAASSGQRRVPKPGNAGATNRWVLSNLEVGTNFWSVQAIDPAFAGSAFAAEGTFAISNARPAISSIANRTLPQNVLTEVPFTIGDPDTPAGDLTLSARSSNTNVVPNQSFSFGGSGTNRTVQFSSAALNGTATITVTVTDPAGAFAFATFTVTVQQFALASTQLPRVQYSAQAWADYDRDGDLDVLIAGETTNNCSYPFLTQLHRNQGNGVFTNAGVVLPGVIYGTVAWADFDNDGDLDFVLTGRTNSGGAITRLYRNNDDGSFSLATNAFTGLWSGALAWGDYDSDGDLDLLMAGLSSGGNSFSALYRNNSTGTFTSVSSPIPASSNGAISWGDFDNDGDLDILATGNGIAPALYRNNGNGAFTPMASAIPSFSNSAQTLGDFDNDGDFDVLIAGLSSGVSVTRIYRNDGNFVFTSIATNLPGRQLASVAWGDYDNDGWLDALVVGSSNGVTARVYHNNAGTNFTDIGAGLPGTASGSAAWVDYDNDGDLDALLVGTDGVYYCGDNGVLATLCRNSSLAANTPPAAPTNLAATVTGRNVVLSWAKASDGQTTNANGLNYQLRVGTNTGGAQIISPNSAASGFRRVTAFGLTTTNRWRLQNLFPGTYYWSVQAVDPALSGSAFAPEASFVITNTQPTAHSQVIVLAEDTSRAITLTGSDADGQLLTYNIFTSATNGALIGTPPNVTYRPVTNFFGGDSFAFQISDGITNSAPAVVLLVVTQVQDVAVATLGIEFPPGGPMQLSLNAEPYERYRIEASEDLKIWTPVTNVIFTNPPMLFIDPAASNFARRFYRSAWEFPMAAVTAPGYSTSGQFRASIAGDIGRRAGIEVSSNLADWIVLTNVVLTNSATPFTDVEAFKFNRRFYRISQP